MSEMRVSDLHLKKELTQIRKAARVLRDPGTTSSWKSPLSSSRSVAASSAWKKNNGNNSQLHSHLSLPSGSNNNGKDKMVFLCNWKNYKSSTEKHNGEEEEEEEECDEDGGGNDGSSSLLGSFEDSLSDARNGCDSKSDTCLGVVGGSGIRSSIFRCKDSNPVPSTRRALEIKKKSKKSKSAHLDVVRKYQQREVNIIGKAASVNPKHHIIHGSIGYSREDSVGQSDDTEDYCNSEDLTRNSGPSPLLLKLKHKNWAFHNSKLLKSNRKDDSSYSTPAMSTSSYNRYGQRNPSTVGSWDGTTTSVNDADDEVDDLLDLPGRQGCGIPCYWSKKTPKHQGMCRSCYSPSLSDTLRRKGSSMLCGSQTIYPRHRRSLSSSHKRRISSRSAQGVLPLLTNSDDVRGSSIGTGMSDDELSTNYGEIDLEGISRLDGRRWSSSCRSQEGWEVVAFNGEGDDEGTSENSRSFSQKYKPMFFSELIGQNIVVQSLINAVSRGRIASVYLFQGPRGTGKTSVARIFAGALNCIAPDETKPCGYCRECTNFISGKSRDILEVNGTNKKGIDRVRHLLKRLSVRSSSAASRYMVFVIDECHLLPSKTWLAILKSLEDRPQRVVFIFITTDLDNVPRTIQSRCQKYLFNKIKDADIVARLRKISAEENLDVETDALDLIAVNADGSLRDAETMLEQLSLLGKRITTSLVNELMGVVSDEKLLELLELAMSSDTAETVKRARELMDSGVDPIVLMSQLATLIMDIIAGSYTVIDDKPGDSFFGGRSLNESELERLKHALKLLSEAEKQLRTSSERSTWFTATLLQLGSMPSPDITQSTSSRRQSSKATDEDPSSASREVIAHKHKADVQCMPRRSTSPASLHKGVNSNPSHQRELSSKFDGFSLSSKPSNSPIIDNNAALVSFDDRAVSNVTFRCIDSGKLCDIWTHCIGRCHSKTLKQLLHNHGKLVSICEVEGLLVAYVAFVDADIKLRAERFLSSITNSMEMVLRRNVEVRTIHLLDGECEEQITLSGSKQVESIIANQKERREGHTRGKNTSSDFPPLLDGNFQSTNDASDLLVDGNGTREKSDIPMQRIESIIREQRLETAWLQAVGKGSPGSLSRMRPEKNQVLPQEGLYCKDPTESMNSTRFSSQHREDDISHEAKVLKAKNETVLRKEQIGIGRRADCYSMSPSLLHDGSLVTTSIKESLGYESGPGARGCNGFLCWNNSSRRRVKVKGTPVRKVGRFSLFGECGKSRKKS